MAQALNSLFPITLPISSSISWNNFLITHKIQENTKDHIIISYNGISFFIVATIFNHNIRPIGNIVLTNNNTASHFIHITIRNTLVS